MSPFIIPKSDTVDNKTDLPAVAKPRPVLEAQQEQPSLPVREYREIELPDITLEDLSPEYRTLVGDNLMLARQQIAFAPDAIETDLTRSALRDMGLARKLSGPTPSEVGVLAKAAQKVGMTEDEFKYWEKNDPKLLEGMILDHDVLDLSGVRGYITNAMRSTRGAEELREDARALAAVEAWMLGTWETGLSGTAKRVWYDTRVGAGQVGVFGAKAMAGLSRGIHDAVRDTEAGRKEEYPSGSILGSVMAVQRWLEDETAFAAEWWKEKAEDAEASWLGPAIRTGDPKTDWLRTTTFRGLPFLGMSVGLAMAAGPAAAAAIIGTGMGLETSGELRADGVPPGLAAAAGVGVAITSYFLNSFQLDRWTRALGGRSPLRLFSAGTALEVGQEMVAEHGEALAQGTLEATARLISLPGYDRDAWWKNTKESFWNGVDEGTAAGTLAFFTRLFGLPGVARGQARAYAFNKSFTASVDTVGETGMYKKRQDRVLADHLNGMARHHGGAGIVFSSVQELEQGGLTKAELTRPLDEGGLGISSEEYELAQGMNVDLAIPYGNAVVFARRQKDAGNEYYQDVLRADPDAMTGREIMAQQREVEATLALADATFKAMENPNDTAIPERIRIFRAGLRAGGFDAREADASAAVFWARAQRAAELWSETPEQWLERQDVQLEMQDAIKHGQAWTRYQKMLAAFEKRPTAVDVFAEAEQLNDAPGSAAAQEALKTLEEDQTHTTFDDPATQPGIEELAQPVLDDEDNVRWAREATDNLMASFGMNRETSAALAGQIDAAILSGMSNPDVRAMAKQLGIALPQAAEAQVDAEAEEVAQVLTNDDTVTESHLPLIQHLYPGGPQATDEMVTPGRVALILEPVSASNTVRSEVELLRGENRGDLFLAVREYAKRHFAATGGRLRSVQNIDTGKDIAYAANNARKAMSYVKRMELPTKQEAAQLYSTAVLPDLLRSAIVVDIHPDTHGRENVGNVYEMAATFRLDGDDYLVKITAPEYLTRTRSGKTAQRTYYSHHTMERIKRSSESISAPPESGSTLEYSANAALSIRQKFNLINNLLNELEDGTTSIEGGEAIGTLYQSAFHGSPYRFDKFTLDAIGTGEGAQAYGWGLYFAGDRAVSEWYRKRLAARGDVVAKVNGEEYFGEFLDVLSYAWGTKDGESVSDELYKALDLIVELELENSDQVISVLEKSLEASEKEYMDERGYVDSESMENDIQVAVEKGWNDYDLLSRVDRDLLLIAEDRKNLALLRSIGPISISPEQSGQLYKVEIPESSQLLDLDSRLSQQPETVRKALDNIVAGFSPDTAKDQKDKIEILTNPESIGEDIYKALSSMNEVGGDEEASKLLNKHGVAGNRYLDGNSRNAPDDLGSHNYVIFDDAAIEILETYYQDARGSISFSGNPGDPNIIRLFKGADISTVIHELNHLFVNDLRLLIESGRANDQARADWAALSAFTGGGLENRDAAARRAAYEQIASAWERYAMDGRAPSPELFKAFDTFRTYISRVYENARQAPEFEATPQVRAIFERWLATDQQIAEADLLGRNIGNWEDLALSDLAARERVKTARRERDAARRRQKDISRGGGRALRELGPTSLEAQRAEIRGEEANTPVYRAASSARKAGGFSREAVVNRIGEPAAVEIEQRHGADIFGGEADLDAVAAESGFDGADDMLANLAGAYPVEQVVEARREQELNREEEAERLRDEEEGMDDGPALGDDGRDMEEEYIAVEVEEAIREAGGGARALRKWHLDRQAAIAVAERTLGKMDMYAAPDIRRFEKARNDAEKAARKAAGRGDKNAVAEQLKLKMLHHYMIREARKARELGQRVTTIYSGRRLRATIEGGEHKARMENEYAEAVKAIVTFMGFTSDRHLRPQNDGEIIPFPTYEEGSNIASFLPDIAGSVEPWLANKTYPQGFQSWRSFTYDQIKEADRVLKMLIDQGRGKLHALRDAEAADLGQLIAKSTEPMKARDDRRSDRDFDNRPGFGRVLNQLNRYLVSLTCPEYWFMAMDGNPTIQGKEAGINQRLFWKMRDCQLEKDRIYKELMTRIGPHLETLRGAKEDIEQVMGSRFFSHPQVKMQEIIKKGLNQSTYDADMMLAIALSMGNDASMYRPTGKRMVDGKVEYDIREDCYNFTEAELAAVAKMFTADQWRAIQGVWDALDSLYPQLDEVTFRITNRHVVKEKAQPLTVETRDGQIVALRGGYFPMVNDPNINTRGATLAEGGNIEEAVHAGLMNTIHQSTKPQAGMTRERLRDEYGNPVVRLPQILSTSVMIRHLNAATHYISHAEALLEFDRLTRSEDWRKTFVDKFGQEKYRAIRNWVQDLARPNRQNNEPGQQILEKFRTLATINALGLRPTTAAKQQLGLFQAAAFMSDASRSKTSGWKWIKKGWREMGWGSLRGAKSEKMLWVDSQSQYMTARDGAHDRELNANLERISPLGEDFRIPRTNIKVNKKDLHNRMFSMIQASDRLAAYSVWIGAYEQAMAGEANFDIAGMDDMRRHEEAVRYADAAAATQASSFAADLTAAQRSTGIMRFMSMFMSGNIRQLSRIQQYADAYKLGDKTGKDVAGAAFREFMAPALAWVLLRGAIMGGLAAAFGTEPDDDDMLTEAAWEVLETTVAPVPFLRDLPSVFRYRRRGELPAIAGPMESGYKFIRSAERLLDSDIAGAAADVAEAVGFWTGIPVMNPLRQARPLTDAVGLTEGRKPRR